MVTSPIKKLCYLPSSYIHLHRMVNDKISWTNWIYLLWITTKSDYCITHCSKINDSWYSTRNDNTNITSLPKKTKYLLTKNNGHRFQFQFKPASCGRKITYVKSCNMTRAGLNGISTDCVWFSSQFKMLRTSFSKIWKLSQFLMADSNKTRIENGSFPVEVLTTEH